MSNNVLEYKGYHTKISVDFSTNTVRGRIEGINDLVDFESESPDTIEQEFKSAVDDYLEFCKEVGKEPEKEYKGTFNVRIKPDLHKKIAVKASKMDISLNAAVENAIEEYVSDSQYSEYDMKSYKQKVADGTRFCCSKY